MNGVDPLGWDHPLDDVDDEIMGDMRAAWLEADPLPPGLVDQVRFALDLADIEVEMLALAQTTQLTAARGDQQTRRITFSDDGLSVMISVDQNPDGTMRLDGWLAPPAACRIELRTLTGRVTTDSDDEGRFAMDRVPRGLVQLVVRLPGSRRRKTVTTPTVEL